MYDPFVYIFFFYGLAFFCMGLVVILETWRSSDERLRYALPALAVFGFLHGFHEWFEILERLDLLPLQQILTPFWEAVRLGILSLSFLSLAIFGTWMFARDRYARRLFFIFPLILATVWGFGILVMMSIYPPDQLSAIADVWSRYTLGVPAALAASAGLIFQQREMRRQGMVQFGRDCLWAATAFFWYGVVGQTFIRPSSLPPSTFWNANLFQELFGFPVQMLRATAAVVAAVFIIHFLRLFEVENQRRIRLLQEARIQEAERREAQGREMLGRVVAAQESERQRVARDLHDATGQSLTALGLGLRSVSTQLNQDSAKAATNLRQLEGLVANAMVELQRLIADLRPSHLDDLGLPAAVRWYAAELQNRALLKVDVEVEGENDELSSEIKIALFRIIQEALTNVLKHARASQVMIYLDLDADSVRVRIDDNGRGFDQTTVEKPGSPSWGLMGMRERVTLLSGEFYLFSRPGWGTRIEVEIPIQPEMRQEEENEDTTAPGG